MADYTRKEAELIRTAYDALAYLAECSSWSNPPRLREALRYETKQRKGQLVAKALMVREALEAAKAARGVQAWGRDSSPSELWYRLSPGILTAYLFAAWCGSDTGGRLAKLTDEFITKATLAAAAHQAAIDRGWAAI